MRDCITPTPTAASQTSTGLARQSQPDDEIIISEVLAHRFKILKFLGAGRSSLSYMARDYGMRNTPSDPSRLVRLRVLSDDAAVDKVQKELFYLEAYAAARLSHKNITRTTPAEQVDGLHFYTIEQGAETESLRSLLDLRGWLEPEVAISVTLQIAEALDYAHSAGVLHLNLDPRSVLIEPDGTVLVTDFGINARKQLAWAHEEISWRHAPHYISPEQARGSGIDHNSDLYSVGILLYEMLTDRLPFNSPDIGLIKKKHLTQTPQPPQVYCQGVSTFLSALVMTLLEKSPDRRFQSAAELRLALNKVAQAGPVNQAPLNQTPPPVDEAQSLSGEDQDAAETLPGPIIVSEITSGRTVRREFFEPPVITVIDPPAGAVPDPSPIEHSSIIPAVEESARPRAPYISTARPKRRKSLLVLVAAVAAMLLLVTLLGRYNLGHTAVPAVTDAPSDMPRIDAPGQPELDRPAPAEPAIVPAPPVKVSTDSRSVSNSSRPAIRSKQQRKGKARKSQKIQRVRR